MARVLVDTSAVYALLDRSDARHAPARTPLEKCGRIRSEPRLTNVIGAECHALAGLGASFARKWLLANVWAVDARSPARESSLLSGRSSDSPTRMTSNVSTPLVLCLCYALKMRPGIFSSKRNASTAIHGPVARRMVSIRVRSSDAEGPFAASERCRSISSSQRAMYSSTAPWFSK